MLYNLLFIIIYINLHRREVPDAGREGIQAGRGLWEDDVRDRQGPGRHRGDPGDPLGAETWQAADKIQVYRLNS